MSFSNPFSAKTDGNTTVTATELNTAGANISNSVDGAGGGTYTGALTFSNVTMSSTNRVKLASRSITRTVEIPLYPAGSTTHWFGVGSNVDAWQNGAAGTSPNTFTNQLVGGIHLPDGVSLNSVTVYYQAASGHGALPSAANITILRLFKRAIATGSAPQIGSDVSDPSGSTGAFEAYHAITLGSLNEVINRATHRYYIIVNPEQNTNSRSGGIAYSGSATYTTTAMDED